MAPEQVRGETHRLDGRTDVWAIGVMLYRCLLGRQPFAGRDYNEIFDEILNRDPKPPRQIDDKIPRELERICLKCLSRRMADRYETAADLADDLKRWLVAEASTDAFSEDSSFRTCYAAGRQGRVDHAGGPQGAAGVRHRRCRFLPDAGAGPARPRRRARGDSRLEAPDRGTRPGADVFRRRALRTVGQRQVVPGQGRRPSAALSPGPCDLRRGLSRRDRGRHSRRAAS